jgi:hypothetical protein
MANDRVSHQKPDRGQRTEMPEYYRIIIKSHLDQRWSDWLAGLKITYLEGNETLLTGYLPDQAALHGLLERIRDLNIPLISVTYCGPFDPLFEKQE